MSFLIQNKKEMAKILIKLKKGFSKDKRQYKIIRSEILKSIAKEKSPVDGFNKKFQKYSKNYAKQKKNNKLRPVTLKDEGDMLKSLTVNSRKTGAISIFFKSRYAKYHNGEGLVDRRILPQNGETFKKSIMNRIKKRAAKLFK